MTFACYADPARPILDCTIQGATAGAYGEGVLGLMIASVLIVSFYVASGGRVGAAAVLTSVAGGVLISGLPARYAEIAQMVIFLGIVAALLAVGDKYVLRGA